MNQKIELVQRVEFIKNICREKKVLHLGCTDAPFTQDSIEKEKLLHFSLKEISKELYGFDINKEGLAILAGNGIENLFYADLEKPEEVNLNETFDVIIARANLKVSSFYFYDIGKEYREHNNKFANLINDVSVKISPQLSEGIIAVCQRGKVENN
jgi:hypothetical protein